MLIWILALDKCKKIQKNRRRTHPPVHVKEGTFFGPSRGRKKTQNMARPSVPFELPFVDPPTIAALKNNFNGLNSI
jgi:hypothetical protein